MKLLLIFSLFFPLNAALAQENEPTIGYVNEFYSDLQHTVNLHLWAAMGYCEKEALNELLFDKFMSSVVEFAIRQEKVLPTARGVDVLMVHAKGYRTGFRESADQILLDMPTDLKLSDQKAFLCEMAIDKLTSSELLTETEVNERK